MSKFDDRVRQFPYRELERQIRIERSLAVSTFARDVLYAFARWVRVLAVAGVRLVRGLAAERRRRRAVFELQRFDDRSLADMGVTRGEIESAVLSGRPRRLAQTAQNAAGAESSQKRLPGRATDMRTAGC
jgi:uncharacterized protein YjiS (DUF1127 family)